MSSHRHKYYAEVRKRILNYDPNKIEQALTLQDCIYDWAIKKAIDETKTLPDGDERMKIIDYVLFSKKGNIVMAAMEFHYSDRTIIRWTNRFINKVLIYSGNL